MKSSAYILDWTMNDYPLLLDQLKDHDFEFEKEKNKEHVNVIVPLSQIDEFSKIIQNHLNAPFNYVDIQYPAEKKTVLIFQNKKFIIENKEQNDQVIKWAIDHGLPEKQAQWGTSF
jgi:hypothetical protein